MANNEIASAFIALYPKLDTSSFDSELGRVANKSGNAGKNAGSSFGSSFDSAAANGVASFGNSLIDVAKKADDLGKQLTRKITIPATAAATATAGIVIGAGWNRLVQIDDARAKLTALGHDAETVSLIVSNANEAVLGTSFSLADAATAAASAVAAGIQPGEELARYLTLIGDTAAVAGAEFNDIAETINKATTNQRVYTRELQQLANQGIPVYQWLQDELNVTSETLREMVREGEVSSEILLNAIEKNIGGAAKTIGELSLSASWDNLQASIARIGANFLDAGGQGGGFFSQMKPLLNELTDITRGLEVSASDYGVAFGKAFADAIGWVRQNSDVILDFGQVMFDTFRQAASIVQGFIGTFVDLYNSLKPGTQDLVRDFGAAALAVSAFAGPLLRVLSPALKAVGALLTKSIAPAIDNFVKEATKGSDGATILGKAAGTTLGGGFQTAAIGVGALALALAGIGWSQLITRTNDLQKATSGLSTAATESQRAYDNLASGATNSIGQVVTASMSVDSLISQTVKLADSISESFANVGREAYQLDTYVETIQRLGNQGEITDRQLVELGLAVDGFNELTGASLKIIDETTGELNLNEQQIYKTADAWKELAYTQVLQEKAKEVMSNLADARMTLAGIDERLAKKEIELAEAEEIGFDAAQALRSEVEGLKREQREASDVVDEHTRALDNWYGQLDEVNRSTRDSRQAIQEHISSIEGYDEAFRISSGSIEDFSQDLANLGIDTQTLSSITDDVLLEIIGSYNGNLTDLAVLLHRYGITFGEEYSAGIDEGSAVANEAITNFLDTNVKIPFEDTARLAPDLGGQTSSGWTSGFASNTHVANTETKRLADNAVNNLQSIVPFGSQSGNKYSFGFANSVGDGVGLASGNAHRLADAAQREPSAVSGRSFSWGSHIGSNFAAGISSMVSVVAGAAARLASAVASYIQHTKPEMGALSVGEQIFGKHLVENFAEGIDEAQPILDRSLDNMADNAYNTLSGIDNPSFNSVDNSSVGSSDALIYQVLNEIKNLRIYLYPDDVIGKLSPAIDAQLGEIYG